MELEYDFSKGKRGAIAPIAKGKIRIAIRLDDDILEWFRAEANNKDGDNYQTSINEALRQHIHQQTQESLESLLRRVSSALDTEKVRLSKLGFSNGEKLFILCSLKILHTGGSYKLM